MDVFEFVYGWNGVWIGGFLFGMVSGMVFEFVYGLMLNGYMHKQRCYCNFFLKKCCIIVPFNVAFITFFVAYRKNGVAVDI